MLIKNSISALVIDNEKNYLDLYKELLLDCGIEKVFDSIDNKKIMSILDRRNIKIIIFDLSKHLDLGVELFTAIRLLYPEIPLIISTDLEDIELAVDCIKKGAFEFIKKTAGEEKLERIIKLALNSGFTFDEIADLRKDINYILKTKLNMKLKNASAFSDIITNSDLLHSIFIYCEAISRTDNTVFIAGETGTGKELIAKAIHKCSNRKGKFVTCNIAGMDDQMVSDTLFGHIKGAFTGAVSVRKGLVEEATGGTLFLDEIGDLNPVSQVKLLRLLQEKEYHQLGSDSVKKANLQIVTATNKNIKQMSDESKFRKDLYYRLITHYINIPSLKERIKDIPLLLDHFLTLFSEKYRIKKPSYHSSLLVLLQNYKYPGNIRELESMVSDALINHNAKMLSSDIFKNHIERNSFDLDSHDRVIELFENMISKLEMLPGIKESADILVNEAIKRCKGNQSQAARLLNISHQALNRRLKNL